jgi:type VI secretion system secreted protein VgrG
MFSNRAVTAPVGADLRPRHISPWTAPLAVVAVVGAVVFPAVGAQAAQAPVGLGTAASYSVLGGQTVTNTGPSTLSGNLGVSPGSTDPGFPPGIVGGATHLAGAVALQAQSDLTTAYKDAAGRTPATVEPSPELGGQTLVPGVYQAATALQLTGTVTLNGQGNSSAVFIFQAGSTLITASSSTVNLIGGAQACNVFWQVGSSATLGTTSKFVGTIMALTSVSVNTGVSVNGRALARNGAVTLDDDTFTGPTCASSTGTTVTTTGSANANAKTASPAGTATTGNSPGATGTPSATGTPVAPGTTTPGALATTGLNPVLPILGGSMLGSGLVLLGLSSTRRRRTSA